MKLTMSLIKVVLLTQFSNKKQNFRKIKLILDLENWQQKRKNSRFLKALNQTVLQDIKKSFEDVHLNVKVYQISPASL